MRRLDLKQAARRIGGVIRERLRILQREYPAIGDVRGRGAMHALELVQPGTTTPDPQSAGAIAAACHAQGVVVLTCGTWSNVIRLLPPLVIDDALLADGLQVLGDAVAGVLG
jgi:4-aminobutyrate aminotransferase/(S)-3-amino-2-methylpropionate transaminase